MSKGSDIALCIIQFLIFLGCILLGSSLQGLGIAYAGGLGMLILGIGFNVSTKDPDGTSYAPWDVIQIIMAVIGCVSAVQSAGGMDYLVKLCERAIRAYPKAIVYAAPCITFLMTVGSGTGHTAFSVLPVIAEVAKEQGVRPSRPLSAAVIGSQIGICGSPISAAFIVLTQYSEKYYGSSMSYLKLWGCLAPSCFVGVMASALVASFWGKNLEDDEQFLERLRNGTCRVSNPEKYLQPLELEQLYLNHPPPELPHDSDPEQQEETLVIAHQEVDSTESYVEKRPWHHLGPRSSICFFLGAIVLIILWNVLTSSQVNAIPNRRTTGADGIVCFMLGAAVLIVMLCRLDTKQIPSTQVFRSGATAILCVLGIGWMGAMFVGHWKSGIESVAGDMLRKNSWLLSFVTFFAGCLLYSQTVTTKVIIKLAFDLLLGKASIVAAFPATAALFVLPTYPTVIAAAEMDDTGSTQLGKYVFDHPFAVPGIVGIIVACLLSYALALAIL